MEDEQPLLESKPPVKMMSRGFLPRVRLRWARFIKAVSRSASHLRRRKPHFRLALCMQKASAYFRSKIKGTSSSSSSACSMRRHVKRLSHPPLRHPHRYYDTDDCTEDLSQSLALLHLPTSYEQENMSSTSATHASSPHVNAHLRETRQYTNNHTALACNPTKHAYMHFGGDDHRLKRHVRRWQQRVNGTLSNLGSHKDKVPHDVPKGCVGIHVGVDHTRFIVPIPHLNHPLFASLFECMHENYGLSQSGPLWIPCDVAEFQTLHSQVKQSSKKRVPTLRLNKDISLAN